MRTLLRILALSLLVLAAPAGAVSLRDRLATASERVGISGGSAFDALANVIADTAARSIPVLSASAGFTYRYNPQTEVFERSSETLGPLFLERPDTLGRSKFNINVSYQFVQFDTFDGDDIDRLEAPDPILITESSGGTITGFSADRLQYRLGIRNYITTLSATYGILDDLDVNLLLPLIATAFDVGVTARTVATAGPGGDFAPAGGPTLTGRTGGHAFGVGDVLLRLKYRLPELGWLRSAAGLQLRLPSGDEDEFQGTGDVEVSPAFYAGTTLWDRLAPYVNVICDLNADDPSQTQVRWGAGADVDITRRFGFALAFLGRHELEGTAEDDETDFLHLTPAGPQDRPLLGLDFGRKDYFDLSFGVRVVVWREIMLFANGIYALNDDGLRNDTVIPTAGIEGTF